jgi:hypothetical protein
MTPEKFQECISSSLDLHPESTLGRFWYPEHIASVCKPKDFALKIGDMGKQSKEQDHKLKGPKLRKMQSPSKGT